MEETNWRNWVLVLVLIVGCTLEFIKRNSFKTSAGADSLAAGVTEPYSVRNSERIRRSRAVHQQGPQSADNVMNTDRANRELLEKFIAANAAGSSTTADAAKKAEAKKKEECDEKNPKLDPVTGKPLPCKKKKEKKEEAKKDVPAPATPPKVETPKDDGAFSQIIPGGEVMPQQPAQAPKTFTTLEEWERLLLNSPDAQETKLFIDKFKQNLVTADVFYRITQMMLEDSREDMRRLGVMCAGQTPSTTSFDLLASLIKGEVSGAPARRDAEDYTARYADLSNVAILETLLRSPNTNTFATALAAQKIGDSAKRYLTLPSNAASANTNTNSTGTPTTPAASAASTARIAAAKRNVVYFQRFLGIMQDLSRNPDSNIKTQASVTLSTLQSLIANVQQQTAPVSNPVATTN